MYTAVSVNPAYTSQDCPNCGHRVKKTLSTRMSTCPRCGFKACCDTAATMNILKKGVQLLGIEWQNGSVGHTQTGKKSRTTGEIIASTLESKVNRASDVGEPVTRIPALWGGGSMSTFPLGDPCG